MNKLIFPTTLIILNICSSAVYFSSGDWKKGIYWVSASVLTACVTY